VREQLPPEFQTAEYLQEHGMVDLVVQRADLKKTLENILRLLTKKKAESPTKDIGEGENTEKSRADADSPPADKKAIRGKSDAA